MKVKQVLVIILKKNASNNYKIEDKSNSFRRVTERESKAQIYFLVQKCSSSEDFRFSLFRKKSESPSGNRKFGQVKT